MSNKKRTTTVIVRLSNEENAALCRLCGTTRLNRSNVVRHLILGADQRIKTDPDYRLLP